RPTSGCEPAPRPSVTVTPIWTMRSAFDIVSAWASVLATTKSTPCNPLVIILLTALPPAPPVPNTVIRGFNSRMSGIFRSMLMFASLIRGNHAGSARSAADGRDIESSEALAQPSSDPSDIAAACLRVPRSPRFEMLKMRNLGVNQHPRCGRKSSALCFLRQSSQAERAPDTHRTPATLAPPSDQPPTLPPSPIY